MGLVRSGAEKFGEACHDIAESGGSPVDRDGRPKRRSPIALLGGVEFVNAAPDKDFACLSGNSQVTQFKHGVRTHDASLVIYRIRGKTIPQSWKNSIISVVHATITPPAHEAVAISAITVVSLDWLTIVDHGILITLCAM